MLLLAQAGVPFTSGFIAKFSVITAAADAEEYLLAVVAMVVGRHRHVLVPAGHGEHVRERADARRSVATRFAVPVTAGLALVIAVGFTVVAGVVPGFLVDFAHDSVPGLAPALMAASPRHGADGSQRP